MEKTQEWEVVERLTAELRRAEARALEAERRVSALERENADREEWYEALAAVAAELKRERDAARDALSRERGVCRIGGCSREPVVGEVCDMHAYQASVP